MSGAITVTVAANAGLSACGMLLGRVIRWRLMGRGRVFVGSSEWSDSAGSRRQTTPPSVETTYYISSRRGDRADALGEMIRGHWGIENRLHWVKDVQQNEDRNGIGRRGACLGNAPGEHLVAEELGVVIVPHQGV